LPVTKNPHIDEQPNVFRKDGYREWIRNTEILEGRVGEDKWSEIFERIEKLPVHQDMFIPSCKPLPEDCEKTNLGLLKGADEQYRCRNNVHLRWFEKGNWCLGHRDITDPRKDPIKHVACDILKLCARQK